jgi:polar amino acid transport system substrate-binding protein
MLYSWCLTLAAPAMAHNLMKRIRSGAAARRDPSLNEEYRMSFRRRALVGLAALSIGSLALTGCAQNTESGGAPAASTGSTAAVSKDASAATLVPASIRSAGELKIGTSPNYPPNEYINSSGKIVGWSIELTNAVAAKLGLKPNYVHSAFVQILSGLGTGTYDMGDSSFTDTKEREQTVDFVTYFQAGTQWASLKGKSVNPDNACGLRVAGQPDTIQLTEDLPARSKTCVAAGKKPIKIQGYSDQAAATTAVLLGKADATLGDSPVVAYGVKQSDGKLQLAGDVYAAAPYGWPVPQNSKLAPALQAAMKSLIADGTYTKILKHWGVEGGAITTPKINAAKS